jgi:two-component system chemotaxis response regulator CheY
MKVLVVDDEAVFRGLMCEFLLGKGYQVLEASDGVEAVELFEEERPSLVFMDIQMPRMDGLEAIRRIRLIDPEARVVVITASPKMTNKKVAEETGVLEYLSKPVSLEKLEGLMERLTNEGGPEGAPGG